MRYEELTGSATAGYSVSATKSMSCVILDRMAALQDEQAASMELPKASSQDKRHVFTVAHLKSER